MVCTGCGILGADARPDWKEQPPRETLTGAVAKPRTERSRFSVIRPVPRPTIGADQEEVANDEPG
jgi:hypothetical protein